jgi:hypothetical protein
MQITTLLISSSSDYNQYGKQWAYNVAVWSTGTLLQSIIPVPVIAHHDKKMKWPVEKMRQLKSKTVFHERRKTLVEEYPFRFCIFTKRDDCPRASF